MKTMWFMRRLPKNLELSYDNVIYQIKTKSASYAMRGAKVKVSNRKGEIKIIYKGHFLNYSKRRINHMVFI